MSSTQPIRVLSLTYLDDAFVNAQQVNAREVIARVDPSKFEFTALASGPIDPRLVGRANLRQVALGRHGKALRIARAMLGRFDIIWYPHPGPAESIYLGVLRPFILWRHRPALVLPVEGDVAQYDEIPPRLRRRAERLVRSADVVVPISRHVAGTVERRFGRTGPIVPVGVDTRVFAPVPAQPSEATLTVVTVGALKAWKRPDFVLTAARQFTLHRFVVIGDGPERGRLERAAPPNVEFRGVVSRASMPAALKECDVVLHPSRMEGMPKAVLEGMACGLPPVLFDAYQPDFVVHGESGFVVRDEAGMIEALARLLGDARLRQSMGAAAREVARNFDWDIVTRMWADVFHEVAARRLAGTLGELASTGSSGRRAVR